MKHRTIVLAGGTGYLGKALAPHLRARGDRVIVLTRQPRKRRDGVIESRWDGRTLGAWVADVDGADALINLTGRSVNCRYTAANRAEILESRVASTRVLGLAIARCVRPPRKWLNASSATIYRGSLDQPMDETTGELGTGFSVDVCRAWENELAKARTPFTEKVALRTAMVMGPGEGGVFQAFHRLVRWGLGGTLGPGSQFVSWLHDEDFCRAVEWILATPDLTGTVNLTSPHPLPMREFLRELRDACGVRLGLPAPAWLLALGAIVLGTETELLLKSRRVVPARLLESGFCFRHPHWAGAVRTLIPPAVEPSPAPANPLKADVTP